jgi:rod shape-determining protein MreD
MNRTLVVGTLLIGTHILETTVMQYLRIGGIMPQFMLILVVSFALLRGSKEGVWIGIFSGLLYELSFGLSNGMTVLTYAIVGYVCGRLNKNFYRENFIIPFICTLASCFFVSLSSSFLLILKGKVSTIYYLKNLMIPEMIYTLTLALVIYQLTYILNEKLEEKEKGKRNLF